VADREPAVEVAAHDDARLGVAGAVGVGEQLQVLRAERDGIVIGDDALIGEAADVVERAPRWERPIGGAGLGGGAGEARIVAREEGL
jgi:hypothetical protein